METERTKVLIVSRYHPREIFAVRVGEYLLQNNSNPDIKVVKYTGKPDRRTSTYNLRKFIENFNPVISPIILHGEDTLEFDAAIVYCARTKQEWKKALNPLRNFTLRYNGLLVPGRFRTYNTKYNLIDLELNSNLGIKKAINLVENFSEYLIDLYLNKEVKL